MFRRLQFDSLQDWLAIFALLASFSLFVYMIYRVIRMKKKDIDPIAKLPLEEEKRTESKTHERKNGKEE